MQSADESVIENMVLTMSDYYDVVDFCSSDKRIAQICKQNPTIRTHIQKLSLLWDFRNLRLADYLTQNNLWDQIVFNPIPNQWGWMPEVTEEVYNQNLQATNPELQAYIEDNFYYRYFEWVRKDHLAIPEVRKQMGVTLPAPEFDNRNMLEHFRYMGRNNPENFPDLDKYLEKDPKTSVLSWVVQDPTAEYGFRVDPGNNKALIQSINNFFQENLEDPFIARGFEPYGWTNWEIYQAIHQSGLPITGSELHNFTKGKKFRGGMFRTPGTSAFVHNYLQENPQATTQDAMNAFDQILPLVDDRRRNPEQVAQYWAIHDPNIPENRLSVVPASGTKIYNLTLYRLLKAFNKELEAYLATRNLAQANDTREIEKIYRKLCQDLQNESNLPQLRGYAKALGLTVTKGMSKEEICSSIAITTVAQSLGMDPGQIIGALQHTF